MPATIWVPDNPPIVAGAGDDEFSDNSGGVPTGWTEVDHGSTATVVEREWGLEISRPTGGGDQIAGIYKAIPSGDFTITTKLGRNSLDYSNYAVASLTLFEDAATSTADMHILSVWISGGINARVLVERWSQYNTFNATLQARITNLETDGGFYYLRIRRNGTTYDFDVSSDGIAFQRTYTTGALGYVPAHMGITVNNTNQGVTVTARAMYFRYQSSDIGLNAPMNSANTRTTVRPL